MIDPIKESFKKVKEEIDFLFAEILDLKQELAKLREDEVKLKPNKDFDTYPALQHISSTYFPEYNGDKPYLESSIGNYGVSTDRQTDRQTTDRHKIPLKTPDFKQENAFEVLEDIRLNLTTKFGNLTKQEFLIFSNIYILNEEKKIVTYKDIATKTKLTESSVRDYVSRLVNKGVPILREKINNKMVSLKIPRGLKDVTSLDAISENRAKNL
ncbi:MAG: hypothetical protein ABH817_02580 [archaeon]